jgi:hypothetical protein
VPGSQGELHGSRIMALRPLEICTKDEYGGVAVYSTGDAFAEML